ncbi:MAG TPA: amino acid ABC transporter permease [Sedimentibacter sp.]|mgnify:FL=1|jgi:His/Glu/Gln/Arg/opine family amino acid ABC transporter permease subunit|nr:amino acid ABC transporter permease [Sedimentibacter sp.]HOW22437.1 amino acid ABC transporter permease [Sedimentibacter sp.]HRC80910.1 amino acid ABC transporter permease [Sedimentibacter sp.]
MEAKVLRMLVPMTLEGLKVTLGVFAVTLLLSLPLAVVVAKLRMSKNRIISKMTGTYIYIMRGTPLLLQLMFIFFGFYRVPYIGYPFSREQAIVIAFVLNYTAYFAEIFRGGINSIDVGQHEAALVLGLSKTRTFMRIILPQVIKNVLPSIGNEVITLVKDTSLVYILGSSDILKAARSVSNVYAAFSPYIYIGLVYMVIIAVLTRILDKIESRFDYYR